MNQIKSTIKYLLSFFKLEWKFEDYPLETWTNLNAEQEDIRFGAKFTNWSGLIAHGNSKSEAIENLKNNLMEYSKENTLPRPGTKVPIEFAESSKIEQYEEIAIDFFERIIGINYYECFISDYSSLYDFQLDDEETIEKIKSIYQIEPDSDLLLVNIFGQIESKSSF